MTQEEILENLMKPRYKVIADYPGSKFSIGQIISMEQKSKRFPIFGENNKEDWEGWVDYKDGGSVIYSIESFRPYPHLFKCLEWWEERTIEEMPKYVKWLEKGYTGLDNELSGIIEEVKDVQEYLATFCFKVDSQINGIRAEYFAPSSKKEYLNYIKQKQP